MKNHSLKELLYIFGCASFTSLALFYAIVVGRLVMPFIDCTIHELDGPDALNIRFPLSVKLFCTYSHFFQLPVAIPALTALAIVAAVVHLAKNPRLKIRLLAVATTTALVGLAAFPHLVFYDFTHKISGDAKLKGSGLYSAYVVCKTVTEGGSFNVEAWTRERRWSLSL